MTKYSKFNIIYRLQKWMDSVPGQTFLNYAYSWGASIVIAGTLFKLTHLPGANLMLFIGMGTEVLVFFLSAFDRPFDKTTDGMDLQTHYNPEEEDDEAEEREGMEVGESDDFTPDGEEQEGQAQPAGPGFGGGTIIIGGGGGGAGIPIEGQEGQGGMVAAVGGTVPVGGVIPVGGTIPVGGGTVSQDGEAVEGGAVAQGGGVVQGGSSMAWVTQQQQISPEMAEATESYVDELKELTEMLKKVNEQSVRLTRDSEEMENLNRTLTGITKVYEMQLKSASQQIGTIDQINEQSKKMAEQIEQLNKIYARMIEAMTVNMRQAAPTQPQSDSLL
ncbi:MAG: gliding motility protein GldL [Prevotella sp.]|nr:gliding motility protein GldL [Prevotella sp.]